jgi:hypothetical protein
MLAAPVAGIAAEEANPDASAQSPKTAEVKPAPPKIELKTGLRLVVRPTILGLVPLRDPENFGEALVRVRGFADKTLLLHYEIKEQLDAASASSTTAFREDLHETTVIRRGDIGVNGIESAAGFCCPLFWDDGSWLSDGSLLWLSRASFAELSDKGVTAWNSGCPAETSAPTAFSEYVAALRSAAQLPAGAPIELRVGKWDSSCPAVVNGERMILPCIYAVDNIGLAEYWILDDPANPLIMKMSYLPAAVGSVTPKAAGTALNFGDMAQSGAGYAITEISF